MSFNKYFIPEPAEFASLIKRNGPKSTVNRKIDAIIGNSISIQMFDAAYDLIKEDLSESDVIDALTQKFPSYFDAKSS